MYEFMHHMCVCVCVYMYECIYIYIYTIQAPLLHTVSSL